MDSAMDPTSWCFHCEKFIDSELFGAFCSKECMAAECAITQSSTQTLESTSLDTKSNCTEDNVLYHDIAYSPSPSPSFSSPIRVMLWAQHVPSGPAGDPNKFTALKAPALLRDVTKHPSGTHLDYRTSFCPPQPSPPIQAPLPHFRADDDPTPSPESATSVSSVSTPSASFQVDFFPSSLHQTSCEEVLALISKSFRISPFDSHSKPCKVSPKFAITRPIHISSSPPNPNSIFLPPSAIP